MKVELLQENLNKALSTVSRIVSSRNQLPILSNVLLTTDKGKLKLTATNLETGINLWLGGKIISEGKICVPAKIFGETVASLPPDTITLATEQDKLKLTCAKYKIELNTMGAEEFPLVPTRTAKKQTEISLPREATENSLAQVAIAAASDESRPVFTGVRLEFGPSGLRLAATDGYRLSVKTIKGISGTKEKKELLVPARALIELVRLMAASDKEAREIILSPTEAEKQLILALPDSDVVTRLLEGEFPDFDKIIPTSRLVKLELNTEELLQAVRSAAVFARDSANIIKFKVTKSGLVITANAPQVGANEAEVEAKVSGENLEIAFNSRYLLEMLTVIGKESLTLELSGPLSPAVFRPAGADSFLHIIMPVRVQA